MLEVSVLTKESLNVMTERLEKSRKIILTCPICGWVKQYKERIYVDRTFSRMTEKCINPDCNAVIPDVGRLLDQPILRLIFTSRRRVRGEDQNYIEYYG